MIAIISILLGMLLAAITTVTRYSRDTIARSEVKTLENAWKQYYAHYRQWPPEEELEPFSDTEGEGTSFVVDPELARALEGNVEDSETLNPDGLSWMEFTRFDGDGYPTTPWGNSQRSHPDYRFYVRFDDDYDGIIDLPGGETLSDGETTEIWRSVIVWTRSGNPRKRGEIIGSWQE